jgi:hypothetical protein
MNRLLKWDIERKPNYYNCGKFYFYEQTMAQSGNYSDFFERTFCKVANWQDYGAGILEQSMGTGTE